MIYQIALALDYIHLSGYAHRDLKPDNIVFRVQPHPLQIPQPVLIDFGLSEKRQLEPVVRAAALTHSAPERVEEFLSTNYQPGRSMDSIDQAAGDMWSLGILAYELLNGGAHPYGEVYKMKRSELADAIRYRKPKESRSEVPSQMQKLLTRMLSHDPSERPKFSDLIKQLKEDIEFLPPRI